MKVDFGISVLIPIYNISVLKLVNQLLEQFEKSKMTHYQILCFDDGSKEEYKLKNRALGSQFRVNYVELSENQGRAKIRNTLAKMAQHKYLLFLDADSGIVSKRFIKKYIDSIKSHPDAAISGGRVYNKKPPRTKSRKLHWLYGVKNESLPANKRNKWPSQYFHTNNFIIPAEIMRNNLLDETIDGYGYEDIVFAEKLIEKNIALVHINNPVKHLDICKTEVFLSKQNQAVENLVNLYTNKKIKKIKLIRYYEKLRDFQLIGLFKYIYNSFYKSKILKNLYGNNPKIRYLQLYKLDLFVNKLKK